MNAKIKIVLAMVVMLGSVGSAQATVCWAGFSGDWASSGTWLYDTGVPVAGDLAIIYNEAVVTVNTPEQSVGEVLVGGYPSGGATLNVAAGSDLIISAGLRLGAGLGNAVVNVSGTASSGYLTVGEAAGSSSTINVYDGGILKVGYGGYAINVGAAAAGAINLNGNGSMVVDGDGAWHLDLFSGRGHIDIESGSLKVLGNYETQLQAYINSGWITGYDNTGTVNAAAFDGTYTVVTAIPEPATMILLGLGGLMLRRREA